MGRPDDETKPSNIRRKEKKRTDERLTKNLRKTIKMKEVAMLRKENENTDLHPVARRQVHLAHRLRQLVRPVVIQAMKMKHEKSLKKAGSVKEIEAQLQGRMVATIEMIILAT